MTTGTIVSGLDRGVYIYGADGEQTNTLTVNGPTGNEICGEIGSDFAIGRENTQEDKCPCECITMNL